MKISYQLLSQPNMAKLTHCEMNLLLEFCKNQDEHGYIYGVHYLEYSKKAHFVEQSFYNALTGLCDKGIVNIIEVSDGYFNLKVKYNDFSDGIEAYKRGYVDLKREVFHKDKWIEGLSSHEKLFVLLLLKCTHENSSSFKIKPNNFYKKFCELFGVTKRVIREYKKHICKFFSMGIKNGLYYITYLHSVFNPKLEQPERFYKDLAYVEFIVKKLKVRGSSEYEREQTANLMHQYRNMCIEKGEEIKTVITNAIYHSTKEFKQKDRHLNFKFLNNLINRHLNNGDHIEEYERPISSLNERELERLLLANN